MFFVIYQVQNSSRCALDLPLLVPRLLCVLTCRVWVVRMQTGPLMRWIGKVYQVIRSSLRDLSSLGLLWSRNWSHCPQQRQNTTWWLTLSRRLSGSAHFLAFCTFPSLVLFLYSLTIRRCVLFQICLRFLLVWSILTFDTISSNSMFRRVIFRQLGYLRRTCQQIFLLKCCLFLFFLAIMMFWVSLFLPLWYNLFFSVFSLTFCFPFVSFSFRFWWGCVELYGHGVRTSSHIISHVAMWTYIVYSLPLSLPQSLSLLRKYVSITSYILL